MKKLEIGISIVLLGLMVSIIAVPRASEFVDNILLMENRNEGYFKYLNHTSAETLFIPDDYDGKNLIVSTLESGNHDGFDVVVNEDGSVTIDGINEEKDVHIRYGRVELPEGLYSLSDGGASEKMSQGFSYVYDGYTLAHLPQSSVFASNNNEHQSYEIGVVIFKDERVSNLTFYPMLEQGEISTEYKPYLSYETYSADGKTATVFDLDKSEFNSITEKDFKLLRTAAKHQYQTDWTTIRFEDGTGIQIIDDDIKYGDLNRIGQITNVISEGYQDL